MEDLNSNKKRYRNESNELESVTTDFDSAFCYNSNKKRYQTNSNSSELTNSDEFDFDIILQDVKKLKDDLLNFLDESDTCITSQDLDSFMKSFEQEISTSDPPPPPSLTAEPGEPRPELGYLLEASDDDLGIPPSTTEEKKDPAESTELFGAPSNSPELSELFRDQVYGFDSFEYGIEQEFIESDGFDGLFEYSGFGFEASDSLWRPETLPAQ